MKDYAAFLFILLLPFVAASCGGSSSGDDQGIDQEDNRASPGPEPGIQIYTFADDSNLTPNLAFGTDDEMVITLGPKVDGDEMPISTMIIQKDDVGSLLAQFSASGMLTALITRDRTIKINKYSYAEGKWFMHFSEIQSTSITSHSVELPQSFADYVSNLDSWMRSRSQLTSQTSGLNKQSQSGSLKEAIAVYLELQAKKIEAVACALSTRSGRPSVILWACQSAIRTTIDLAKDGRLDEPDAIDYAECLLDVTPNGVRVLDAVCLVSTGLKSTAQLIRGTEDIIEIQELADKSMEEDRFIGEDPVLEDFPTPLLTAPRIAIVSPQWRESFTTEQDVQIKVVASESVDVVDYEIRSKDNAAFLISGNIGKAPSGNFEIDIAAENLEAGVYFVTVSASNSGFSNQSYSSFQITNSSWRGQLRITQEAHVSGEDPDLGKFACQVAFSIIGRAEITPVVYDLSMPQISGRTPIRVDSTFGGAGNSRYCTQAQVDITNESFTFIAIRPFYDRGDMTFPRLENSFNFNIENLSESAVSGTMEATASFYDNNKGWHTGSCSAEFALTKFESRAFSACDTSDTFNICQPGSDRCEWRDP